MTTYLPLAKPIDTAARAWENVYQYESNTLASSRRVINQTVARIDLNSKGFGTTSTVDLPHNVLLNNVMLALHIDVASLPTTLGLYLPKGWGYKCIKRLEVQMGGTERLVIDPRAMLVKNIADCESGSKIEDLMTLAGEEYLGNKTLLKSSSISAYLNLYTPFSNMSSSRCMPYDSNLLRKPVQLTIEFATASEIFSYSAGLIPIPVPPSAFSAAYIQTKTGILVDGPSGMAQLVGPMSNESYTYAWVYPQYFSHTNVVGSSDKSAPCSVELRSFRAGSVMSMDLWVTRDTYGLIAGNDAMTRSANNALFAYKLRNIEILYAGNPIYRADDDIDDLLNLTDYTSLLAYDTNIPNYYAATTPILIVSSAEKSRISHVQLSQFNERFFSNLVQSGPDMVSQSVQIRFNTPNAAELALGGVAVTADVKFTLHVAINYQAGVRTARGETSFIFLPPQ